MIATVASCANKEKSSVVSWAHILHRPILNAFLDRVEPTCGWCARNDRVCEYRERKKPGLRAGYGRELEGRIDRLEAILRAQDRRLEDLEHGSPTSEHKLAQQRVPQMDASRHGESPQSAITEEHRRHNSVITPAWPQVQGHDQGQYHQRHGSMSDHASVVGMASPEYSVRPDRTRSSVMSITSVPASTLPEIDPGLPPYDLVYNLVDLYFKHINPWSPILDRKTTFEMLFGSTALEEPERVLLHAIVATTLRFCQDVRLNLERRKRYHDISKQRVQLYGLENSNIRALQALVILALDVTGTSNGPSGWKLLALLSSSVIQLGLAVEKTSHLASPKYPSIATLRAFVLPEPKSWIEDEERRRLFWMVFVLDRYATIATAFEFTLDEKEIDRQLPCRDDIFAQNQPVETRWFRRAERSELHAVDRPENLGSFAYHCELLGTLSRIHLFLKRPIDIGSLADVERWQGSYRELDNELNSWLYNLPSDYSDISRLLQLYATGGSVNWIMLHAIFHTCIIRLHSSAAYPTARSPIFMPSYNAMQRCLAAVDNLKAVGQHVVKSGMLDLFGPPFAFCLWVSARLLLVHGSTMEHELNPDIGFFVSTLGEMGRYWEVAQRYTMILGRVLEEYQETKRSTGVANGVSEERSRTSTVRILADMRR